MPWCARLTVPLTCMTCGAAFDIDIYVNEGDTQVDLAEEIRVAMFRHEKYGCQREAGSKTEE